MTKYYSVTTKIFIKDYDEEYSNNWTKAIQIIELSQNTWTSDLNNQIDEMIKKLEELKTNE